MGKIFRNQKNRYYFLAVIGILLVFLLISISIFAFGEAISKKEFENCRDELNNIAEQGSKTVRTHLNDSMTLLQNTSIFLSFEDLPNKEIQSSIQQMMQNSIFSQVGASGLDGQSYLSDGSTLDISEFSFFQRTIQGESCISNILENYGDEDRFFAISVPHYGPDNQIDGIIYGIYEVNVLSSLLDSSYFSEDGYIHIFDSSGNIILYSNNPDSILLKNTLWKNFEQLGLDDESELDQMKENIKNGESGFIGFGTGESSRYAYYMPLEINNWYALVTIKREIIYQRVEYVQSLIIDLTIEVILVFFILIGTVLLIFRGNWNKMAKINQDLIVTEESFRIAISGTLNLIFNYDIHTNTITIFNAGKYSSTFPMGSIYSPSYFLEKHLIESDSSDNWKEAFSQIRSGEKAISKILHVKLNPPNEGWSRLTLTNIFNHENKVIRSVGILEDITEQYKKNLLYLQEQKYRDILLSESSQSYEINLTKNLIIKSFPNTDLLHKDPPADFSSMLKHFLEHIIHPEDRASFADTVSLQALLEAYTNGKKDIKIDYRHKTMNNEYIWMEYHLYFSKDSATDDIIVNIILRDINAKKQKELSLQNRAQHDTLTQLYNRGTAVPLINQILTQTDGNIFHAFMIIDLDNFKTLNDTLGHIEGDYVLKDVAQKMRSHFRNNDICARLGGDEFIVFMKNVDQLNIIAEKAQQLIGLLNHTYQKDGNSVHISVSIGVSIFPEHGNTFDMLYERADKALYAVKKHQKNSYLIYQSTL